MVKRDIIELNPKQWVLCKSKCARYEGYFDKDCIPPNFVRQDTVLITAKEFVGHFYTLDTSFDRAWRQTVEYFKGKNKGCEFEEVNFSKDDFRTFVESALITDLSRVTIEYGTSYEDWSHIESIHGARDCFMVSGGYDYDIDDVLLLIGLPTLEILLEEYETSDIMYEDLGHMSYKFYIKPT